MSLQQGLVGYWSMDDRDTVGTTLRDRSGYGNHGSIEGGVTTGETSPVGESFAFDKSATPRIRIENSEWNTNEITLALWVQMYVESTENDYAVFSSRGSGGGSLLFQVTTDRLRFWGTTATGDSASKYHSLNTHQWYHIALTYNYDEATVHYYRDGEHTTSGFNEPLSLPGRDWFAIGKWAGNSRHFDGQLSDVRLYNRSLSPAEIKQLADMRYPREVDV